MKSGIGIVLAVALLCGGPAAAAGWSGLTAVQAQPDRFDRGGHRQREPGRNERFEPQDRRQQLSDEERRGLHRDLDKARREIYRPRRDR